MSITPPDDWDPDQDLSGTFREVDPDAQALDLPEPT